MIWTTRPRSDGPGGLARWVAGSGPPLVLVHGVGLRAEAWAAMMPDLAQHFCVHAVDMPGHGASALNGARSLRDYVARLCALIDGLEAPVRLAGHSMGAMIVVQAALERQAIVRGVAALNAIYRRDPAEASAVQARAATLGADALPDPGPTLARWFGASPNPASQATSKACRDWLTDADPEGYARAYNVFAQSDGPLDAQLAQLGMPSLFMTGAHDPNSTPAMSNAMAALAPQGCAHVVGGAAHMMPMTHPAQVCAALHKLFRPTETDRPPAER